MSVSSNSARMALAATVAACLLGSTSLAGDMSQVVEHMASETTPSRAIGGSSATLRTDKQGALMTMHTRELRPGHVTTAWWVIMTNPTACSATPCPPEDVIGRAADVGTQIVYADCMVNSPNGTAQFTAYLPAGEIADGWYNQDFPDPQNAEIHLVLNDHGPLIAGIAASMLTSYRGGCSDDSLPPPFLGHGQSGWTARPEPMPFDSRCHFRPGREINTLNQSVRRS